MQTTRERILAVATGLFAEQGFEDTSLRSIAEPLGFSKAALYYHFHTKDEILLAVVEPAAVLLSELSDRLERVETMEDWADIVIRVADLLMDSVPLFKLLERNEPAIDRVVESDALVGARARLVAGLDVALARPGLTDAERLRVISAVGALRGLNDFGQPLLRTLDGDGLRHTVTALALDILGVDAPARDAPRQSSAAIAAS